jgi:hypothetical protein
MTVTPEQAAPFARAVDQSSRPARKIEPGTVRAGVGEIKKPMWPGTRTLPEQFS